MKEMNTSARGYENNEWGGGGGVRSDGKVSI